MSTKLNMAKKLVSLCGLVLGLMGSFSLEAASMPRKKKSESLTAQHVFLVLNSNSLPKIELLIKDGTLDPHAQYRDSAGRGSVSILMLLAAMPRETFPMNERCAIAKLLLDNGASWKDQSADGFCVPTMAASEGLTELVGLLLDHPTNHVPIDYCPSRGVRNTILLQAIENGHLALVEDLVARGADIHSSVQGRTPWMHARINNQSEIMSYLERSGAKVYPLRQLRPVPLFDVGNDYFSLKDLAVQEPGQNDGGPQVGAYNANGYLSPEKVAASAEMVRAAGNGDMESLKEVLEADPALVNTMVPDHQNGSRFNVVGVAIVRQDCEMISYLLSKGARWDQALDFGTLGMGYIPLGCLECSNPEIINCFLQAGMPIDHVFYNTTLLKKAASLGRADMVKYLLDNGAHHQKIEAAFVAAENGHLNVVKLLCAKDPLIIKRSLVKDGCYTTILLSAVRAQQEDVAKYLLEEGAELSRGAQGVYAEQVEAKLTNNPNIIGLIETHIKKLKARDHKAKAAPQPTTQELLRQSIASLERRAIFELKAGKDRLKSAAALLDPLAQAQPVQAAEQQEVLSKSKKKKNKKKKKAAENGGVQQLEDGGPEQAVDGELVLGVAERDLALLEGEDDGTASTQWSAWEDDIAQAGLALRYEEQQEQAQRAEQARRDKKYQESQELVHALRSFVPGDKSTYEWPRSLILDRYALVAEHEDCSQLYGEVYDALFNSTGKQRRVKAAPTSVGSAKQQKAKSAGAQKQNKGQNHGAGRAGRKGNRPANKSHIPAQWAPTEPLPKAAASVYDRLSYADYVEDDGGPKQQVGDYVLEEDVSALEHESASGFSGGYDLRGDSVGIVPGQAGEDMLFYQEPSPMVRQEWPHAQPDYDGGGPRPEEFEQGDSDAKAQYADLDESLVRIPYGHEGDELVWNREHAVAINLEYESGLHLDPHGELEKANNLERNNGPISREGNGCYALWVLGKIKSFFPSWWTVQDLTNRFVRAVQTGQFTVTDEQYKTKSGKIKNRKLLVGVMDPADYVGANLHRELPVHFMARMVGNTNMIGTVFPITESRYRQYVGHSQGMEEKDDYGPGLSNELGGARSSVQAPDLSSDVQEINLDSWDQDAQDASEQYESVWD